MISLRNASLTGRRFSSWAVSVAVVFRVQVLEGQVFELAAQLTHAEAVRDGRVDVHRLLRDALALLGLEELERAHVVQAVGEFDEHDAHVVDHRQQHLADVLGLLLLVRDVADLRDFRQAVDEQRDFVAEIFPNRFEVDERVFDDIVEQTRRDGDFVEPHVGQDVGDFERVHEVGLARGARLPLVLARGEEVGAAQHIKVGLRVVAADFSDDVLDANHKTEIRSQESGIRKSSLSSDY